ncbi:MAG: hypothetical protein ACI4A3_05640 [Lachnospiraceae bacterium]
MNLQKCKHGHYYDYDKFAKCPYCAAKGLVSKDTLRLNEGNPEGCTEKKKIEQEKSLKDAVAATLESKESMEIEENQTTALSGCQNLPVGILVSVGNTHKGEIVPLYAGDNCVCVAGDNITICREQEEGERIADISYRPEYNLFVIKPLADDSKILIGRMQLKDKVKLSPYDRIIIEDSSFLFVPICGKQFHWS